MSNGYNPFEALGTILRIRQMQADQQAQIQARQDEAEKKALEFVQIPGADKKKVLSVFGGELTEQGRAKVEMAFDIAKEQEKRKKEALAYSQTGNQAAEGLGAAIQTGTDNPTPENGMAIANLLSQISQQYGDYAGPVTTAAAANLSGIQQNRSERQISLDQSRKSQLAQTRGEQNIKGDIERTNLFFPGVGVKTVVGRPNIEAAIRNGATEVGGYSGLSGLTADEAGLTRATRATFEQKAEALNQERYTLEGIAGTFVPEFATYPGAFKSWAYQVGAKISPEKMAEYDPEAAQWLAQYDNWSSQTTEALLQRVKQQSGAAYSFKELALMTNAYLNKDLDPFTFAARLDRILNANQYQMARINMALKSGTIKPDEAMYALDDSPQGNAVRSKLADKFPIISLDPNAKTVDVTIKNRRLELAKKYIQENPKLTDDEIKDLVADDINQEFYTVPKSLRGK